MPTYDYICSNCGRTTEIVHSINGGPPAACPACGAVGTLRKAFNPPTIHFKGSGWAKKDRSGGHSRPARSGEAAATNGTGADGGSESGERHSGGASDDGGTRPEPGVSGEGGSSSRSDEAGTRTSRSDNGPSRSGSEIRDSNKGGSAKGGDSNRTSSDKAGSSAAAD